MLFHNNYYYKRYYSFDEGDNPDQYLSNLPNLEQNSESFIYNFNTQTIETNNLNKRARVYATNYNVLRILSGLNGIAYSS